MSYLLHKGTDVGRIKINYVSHTKVYHDKQRHAMMTSWSSAQHSIRTYYVNFVNLNILQYLSYTNIIDTWIQKKALNCVESLLSHGQQRAISTVDLRRPPSKYA